MVRSTQTSKAASDSLAWVVERPSSGSPSYWHCRFGSRSVLPEGMVESATDFHQFMKDNAQLFQTPGVSFREKELPDDLDEETLELLDFEPSTTTYLLIDNSAHFRRDILSDCEKGALFYIEQLLDTWSGLDKSTVSFAPLAGPTSRWRVLVGF